MPANRAVFAGCATAAESIAIERGIGTEEIAQTEALAVLLDAALQAATGLAQLLRFRGACATAQRAAEREAATACLLNAEAELTKAAEAVSVLSVAWPTWLAAIASASVSWRCWDRFVATIGGWPAIKSS